MQRREGACEKEFVKTYFQALWLLTLLRQGPHLSGRSLGSMRGVPGSMASLMLATQSGVIGPSLAPSHVISPLVTVNLLRRREWLKVLPVALSSVDFECDLVTASFIASLHVWEKVAQAEALSAGQSHSCQETPRAH